MDLTLLQDLCSTGKALNDFFFEFCTIIALYCAHKYEEFWEDILFYFFEKQIHFTK